MEQDAKTRYNGKVLLTGGSGFIASHILDCLLEHGFQVVVTARSHEKGRRIVESIQGFPPDAVSYVVVEDIAREGAFDQAVQATPPFTHAIHSASPYFIIPSSPAAWAAVDAERDFLAPAVRGTTGLLAAVAAHAPSVQRVVLTSSSAAMLTPARGHATVYDERSWADADVSRADAAARPDLHAYRASKAFAERAAWDFVQGLQGQGRGGLELATINNTYTFGPVPRHLRAGAVVNASNQRIRDMVAGRWRLHSGPDGTGGGIPPTAPVFTFVDVRDVALAHVRAMTRPAAAGQRFYVVAGYFSNKRLVDAARRAAQVLEFPHLEPRLPDAADVDAAADDLPDDVYGFDNAKSRRVLGLEYRGLDESVRDTVASLMRLEELVGVADGTD